MTSDLRNRLLMLLVLPLMALATVGVWLDYRSADEAAGRHDLRLLRLLPALADSVLAPPFLDREPPLLLLAPPIQYRDDVCRDKVEDFISGKSDE